MSNKNVAVQSFKGISDMFIYRSKFDLFIERKNKCKFK